MAKKKQENLIKAKVLVNLKYDTEVKKAGEELKIRIEDAEEMVEKGYVELLEDLPKENTESPGEEENSKEGE